MATALLWAAAAAALGAATLSLVLYWQLHLLDYSGPFRPSLAPGEFDLLLTARALAAGQYLPLWAGSVHPDAIGTYLGAIEVAVLLKLGLSDLAALKLCGIAHYAVLCGSATGLAARLGGRNAALLCAGLLVFGAPSLVGAHSYFVGTTTEVIGAQVIALWWIIELVRAPGLGRSRLSVIGCGALLGTALVYSSHTAWLVLFAAIYWLLEAERPRRLSSLAWLLVAIAVAVLPWKAAGGAPGPPAPAFTLKSIPVTAIIAGLGWDDISTLARRLPFALIGGREEGSSLRWLHAGWMAMLLASLTWTLLSRARACTRGPGRPLDGLLAIYAIGALAPMLFAGSLAGYPAAFRYSFNGVVIAAILLGLRYGDLHRLLAASSSRAAAGLLAVATSVALALGTLSLPSSAGLELAPGQAAFFAGQHRIFLVEDDPHRHFHYLHSAVRVGEQDAWLQGYGMLLGEEFSHRLKASGNDTGGPLPSQAELWLAPTRTLQAPAARRSIVIGLGLGIAYDGLLDQGDLKLVQQISPEQLGDLWFGAGAALAERSYWSGSPPVLRVEGGWQALGSALPLRGAFSDGYHSLVGAPRDGLAEILPANASLEGQETQQAPSRLGERRLALPHPFIYNRIAQEGRGEFK